MALTSEQFPTSSIRELGLQEGNPAAFSLLGTESAGNLAAQADQSQQFGLKIMDLLKQYQQLGTRPFVEQGLSAQQEQIKRLSSQVAPELIGASPQQQAGVRAASVGAIAPTITSAQQSARTFSEQLAGFGDTITQARGLIKDFETQENTRRDDARTTINQALTTIGGDAFTNLDPIEVTKLEKIAGYPKGYLSGISRTLKERETILKEQGKVRQITGGQPISPITPLLPSPPPLQPQQTFEQFLQQEEEKVGMTFGTLKRAELQKQFDVQKLNQVVQQKGIDINKFHPTVQLIISGDRKISNLTQTEHRQLDSQINQAAKLGLVPTESTAEQLDTFNKLAKERESSTILKALDRTGVARQAVKDVKKNPGDATNQLNLIYTYVQILDTYQSAVREGELSLVSSLQSRIGQLQASAEKMYAGKIVNTKTALQIADAVERLTGAIDQAAKSKDKSFDARAKTLKIENQWKDYRSGFTTLYDQSTDNQQRPSISSFIK